MRPTDLKFRSPKEATPGPYYPKVAHDGRILHAGNAPRRTSFGRDVRFGSYRKEALKVGYRVGPCSYEISGILTCKGTPLYKSVSVSSDLHYVGSHVIPFSGLSTKNSRRKSVASALDDVQSMFTKTRDSTSKFIASSRPVSASNLNARSSKNRPLSLI